MNKFNQVLCMENFKKLMKEDTNESNYVLIAWEMILFKCPYI